jgi:hypothetical protein
MARRKKYKVGDRIFFEHYNDFYYTLNGDYDLQFDKIIEQMKGKK